MKYLFSIAVGLFALAACSSDKEAAPQGNGVDDVKAACSIRAGWAHGDTANCNNCKGLAISPFCSCLNDPASAACESQENALKANPTCDSLTSCITNCNGDCNCVDGCYVGHDDCRKLASAVDGCVAQTCDATCR